MFYNSFNLFEWKNIYFSEGYRLFRRLFRRFHSNCGNRQLASSAQVHDVTACQNGDVAFDSQLDHVFTSRGLSFYSVLGILKRYGRFEKAMLFLQKRAVLSF